MKALCLLFGLLGSIVPTLPAQDLDTATVRVTLDRAIPLAQKAASRAFPDLRRHVLYSVTPRILKGDRAGMHWQVLWQEKEFPHRKSLLVRVYMKNGRTRTERL